MNNLLVQPDPGLFIWTILTFLILLALLAKFAWSPLLQALDARQASIRKALDDARKAKQDLEGIHADESSPKRTAVRTFLSAPSTIATNPPRAIPNRPTRIG